MKQVVVLFLVLIGIAPFGASAQMPVVLGLQEQAKVRDSWLKERIETVLPGLMRREGIDMWLIIAREYNEDPVLKTM